MRRKIIEIDAAKCNGCGLCMPNCPEGAIQIIDDKARLVSDLFCDGLGACIGHCPQGAITITEREAGAYNERRVMENIVKQGKNVIKAHLTHLKEHGEDALLNQALSFLKESHIVIPEGYSKEERRSPCACPGTKVMQLGSGKPAAAHNNIGKEELPSELGNWPVQLRLVPPVAAYLNNADLLIAADCVPFAYSSFHGQLLKGKVLLVGCPKLDDLELYRQRISDILKVNSIKSITYAHMEVPCCFGLIEVIKAAISDSGRDIPFEEAVIGIRGDRLK